MKKPFIIFPPAELYGNSICAVETPQENIPWKTYYDFDSWQMTESLVKYCFPTWTEGSHDYYIIDVIEIRYSIN